MGFSEYVFPMIEEFDLEKEVTRLASRVRWATVNELERALAESYEEYRPVFQKAKRADTVDRAVSVVCLWAESYGYLAGFFPGLAVNVLEELVELYFKAPVYWSVLKRGEIANAVILGGKEAFSFLPLVGDYFDLSTNIYVHEMYRVIRDDAVRRIKRDKTKYVGDGG